MEVAEWHEVPELPDSDEEERNDYNLEQAMAEFVEELPIRHNVWPDSDDEEDVGKTKRSHERTRNEMNRGNGHLYEGQVFYNGVAFKEVVLDYALKTGRNIKQYRYDKTKIGFSCAMEGCEWRIYCSCTCKNEKWQVKVFKQIHSCIANGECELMKVPVIARLFIDKIREEPEYFMPMKIEELVKEKWKISISRHQCQAARNKAVRMIEREYDEQFGHLRDYGKEILLSNLGSTVEIDTILNEEGLDVFSRFYVCFAALKESWKDTCRPLIGVDGCFLRSKMKGQFLIALGRDANNAIYPIAWAVVQVENKENWLWFVRKLKIDLILEDGDGFILISDRQKGLIIAVEIELPRIEHRMCVRHIYVNLKAKHGKKQQMKPLIWRLAWSYNEAKFNENLNKILNYDTSVFQDVLKTKPEKWVQAFYRVDNHCEDVENNSTESFNNTIVKAREKPFVPMLETVTRLAMVRIAKRDVLAQAHKGKCTPYVVEFLEAEYQRAAECIINRSTNGMYDARLSGCSHRVNLEKLTCMCIKWDITGIPCVHAYVVIISKKLLVEDFVSHWFRTSTWRRTYSTRLVPLRGARFWPSGAETLVHEPPEPPQPGRKKTGKKQKKKKGINESPRKKQARVLKRIMHCGVCGEANHNARFHKDRKQGQRHAEASERVLTQD